MIGSKKMFVFVTLKEGSQLERTMRFIRMMETNEDIPEAVRRLYLMLGDLFPDGNPQEMRAPTDKQLRYISHLAGLTRNEGEWFTTLARECDLDMAQAGHIIMKLRRGS